MLRRHFASETPEHQKVVELIGEFLQCGVQFFDAGESQLILKCMRDELTCASSSAWFQLWKTQSFSYR